ncbi:hypothetical protein TWF788_007410 [Orbilia oligospora]|uniref:NB-ARC domain-containing protein n=1 Tax=Orbilia oligospora TaxID=2813651 RepID=A0A7C8U0M7_ORBOL|nr:hypothetical protein TWF788_007410 [Orbilia oligospora]
MATVGIIAAVLGIITGGGKAVKWLCGTIETIGDAPESMITVMTKMQETVSIVNGLHQLLNSKSARDSAKPLLISVEQLENTIIGIMLCFSKLEKKMKFARDLESGNAKGLVRAKWLYHEKAIKELIERLNSHKISLSMMLQLLSMQSHVSEEKRLSLSMQIERSVQKDPDIQAHLKKRASVNLGAIHESRNSNISLYDDEFNEIKDSGNFDPIISSSGPEKKPQDDRGIATANPADYETSKKIGSQINQPDFQEVLKRSRPYLRMHSLDPRESMVSREGSLRGVTYSIFSQQSIVTISNIAVYNLAISPSDLHNSDWYHFEGPKEPTQRKPPPANFVRETRSSHSSSYIKHGASRIRPATSPDIPISTQNALKFSSRDNSMRYPPTSPSSTGTRIGKSTEPIFYHPSSLARYNEFYQGDFFVKREEITGEILRKIKALKNTETPMIFLWGGFGCGKTAFALDFVKDLPHLSNVQNVQRIFISANRDRDIDCGLSRFAINSGTDFSIGSPPGIDEKAGAMWSSFQTSQREARATWSWLSTTKDPWAIILDDVMDLGSISGWPPLSPRGTVIVTTRLKPPKGTAIAVEVGLFNEAQTIAVAQKYHSNYHNSTTKPADLRFLNHIQPRDLLPIEIPALMKATADKNINLGDLVEFDTRERIRRECTAKQGYIIGTHDVNWSSDSRNRKPLYRAMWDDFSRRDGTWDIDMDSNRPLDSWSARRTMTDAAAFLFPSCCSLSCLRSAEQYFYKKNRPKPSFSDHLRDSDLPIILLPDPSDQDTAKIPRLSQVSYISRMSSIRKAYIVRNLASWLLESFNSCGDSQIDLSSTGLPRHAESLVKNFFFFIDSDTLLLESYLDTCFEIVRVLRVLRTTLQIPSTNNEPSEIFKLLIKILERIMRIVKEKLSSDYVQGKPEVSSHKVRYVSGLADSLEFVGREQVKEGNHGAAVACFQNAKRCYKALWQYEEEEEFSVNKSTLPNQSIRIYDQSNMYSCELSIAKCLEDQDKVQKSIQYLQKTRREMETPVNCVLGLFKYYEGNLHLSQQKYGDALFCYEAAGVSFTKCPQVCELRLAAIEGKRAQIFIQFGKWRRAINCLESALNYIPNYRNCEDERTLRQVAWINSKLAFANKELSSKIDHSNALTYGNSAWQVAKSLDHEAPKLVTTTLYLTLASQIWEYYNNLYQEFDPHFPHIPDCPELNSKSKLALGQRALETKLKSTKACTTPQPRGSLFDALRCSSNT